MSSDYIYALEIDDENRTVWMAAYNGGYVLTHSIRNIPSLRKEDGLSDNIVYSIEKDRHGNLWFSSNAGISAYNAGTKRFAIMGI